MGGGDVVAGRSRGSVGRGGRRGAYFNLMGLK